MPPEFHPAPIETPKNHRKAWLLIILGVILVAVNGYFLFKQLTVPVGPNDPIIKSKQDEFADWKTYRNEEYGFEFKYPQKYDLYENDKIIQVITKEDRNLKGELVNNLTIKVVDNDKNLSVLEWWNLYGPYTSDLAKKHRITPSTFPIKKIKVGNADGIYIPGSEGVLTNYLILSNKNNIFEILVMIPEYQKILSTLKFFSTSTTLDTSNWKMYRNEDYGFEIKFSDKWANYYDITFKTPDFDYILFCLPTADENTSIACPSEDPGFVGLFSIGIYTKKQWEAQEIEHQNLSRILGKKNDLVFAYNKSQDPPDDLIPAYIETKEILSTFKFTK